MTCFETLAQLSKRRRQTPVAIHGRVIEIGWLHSKRGQVVQRIEHLLALSIGALMLGNQHLEVVTVTSSTISGNSADNGGGIYNQGDNLTVTDSTISSNATRTHGGGISAPFGAVRLAHSTITGNVADSDQNNSGQGGGIAIFNNPYDGSVNVTLDHTIVAGNIRGASTRSDIVGPIGGARFSLVGDNTGASIVNNGGNLIGTSAAPNDPMLGPLADNAGPTPTHALLAGSLAIDAGDLAAVAGVLLVPLFDQRGEPFTRVYDGDGVPGARIDMGAVERQPIPSAFFGDYNQNEVVDAADYVVWRKTIGNIIAAYSGADGSGNGSVGQEDYGVWRTHFGQELPPPGAGSGAAATAFGESTVQELDTAEPVPLETPHSEAHANTVKQIALGLFDARPMRRGANYAPRKQVNTFHITDPAEKLIFLLANDRVGPSSRQVLSLVDDQGSDDDPAEEMDSSCLTDDPLSVALAEWR
ncbi:MAG: right-handed parallel beta-helix repeat-containing protein [Pirellulales bacterium]